jgi:hypothetical protein
MKGTSDPQMGDRTSQMATSPLSYFTTIEEHFQRARGTGFFLLSPRDLALVKAWQDAGLPVEAVMRGIDQAFENWRKRPTRARTENVNSLAYCTQAIAAEAQAMANAAPAARNETTSPFTIEEVRGFIARNATALTQAGYSDIAASLEELNLDELDSDFEELERRLTATENNVIARLRANASDPVLIEARCALERDLKPYQGKMSADQLTRLENQFLERRLLESAGLPRLSLFYL